MNKYIETNVLQDNRFLGWNTDITYIVKDDDNGFFTIQYKFINGAWKSFVNNQTYNLSSIDGTKIINLSKQNNYLYTLEYSEYNYEWALNHFKSIQEYPIGACSSFRKGNIYSRNFDWYYNKNIEFVIKTPHTNQYKATLGITLSNKLEEDTYNSQEWYDDYKLLPFTIVDGINEDGVFCNINVVNAIEENFIRTTGTIPSIEKRMDLCMLMLPRYILDNFNTAFSAIDYISKYISVYAPSITPNYEYHFMIGDSNTTYILEFINNELIYYEVGDNKTYPSVMTNFRITDTVIDNNIIDYTTVENYGTGIERYNLLLDNITNINTIQQALQVMSNDLKFTNAYITPQTWLTEFTGEYSNPEHTGNKLTVVDAFEDSDKYEYILNASKELYENRSRDINSNYYGSWHTVHTSVYNIHNKTLTLIVQENNLHTYSYILSI